MVGGTDRALLYRAAGGSFEPIAKPGAAVSATITGISLPRDEEAWLTTDTGELFAGHRDAAGAWSWAREAQTAAGDSLTAGRDGADLALRGIAIDRSGSGFAVGDQGLILERSDEGNQPWRRIDTGLLYDFTSVAIPIGGGPGALVGGRDGVILTLAGGRFQIARQADGWTHSRTCSTARRGRP
jgi:hypothetical protein